MRQATDQPANDNAVAVVRRIQPIALGSDQWIFLHRKRGRGFEFTVVPAPEDARDDRRYLEIHLRDGWSAIFWDEDCPESLFTFQARDVQDPLIALRHASVNWSNRPADQIDRGLSLYRFVALHA